MFSILIALSCICTVVSFFAYIEFHHLWRSFLFLIFSILFFGWILIAGITFDDNYNLEYFDLGKINMVTVDNKQFQAVFDGDTIVNITNKFGYILPDNTKIVKIKYKGTWHCGVYFNTRLPEDKYIINQKED